jgi:prepilin peptidase CpaA
MFWPLLPGGGMANDMAVKLAGLLPLAAILYGAIRAGLRERRIPNQLVLTGIAAGLLLHTVLPGGNGFLAALPGGVGPGQSLGGLIIAAAALLPFYRMGAVGAGQVKLMAAVGAILGPADIIPAVLGTLLAGGGVGLAVTLRRRCAGRLFVNFAAMARRAWGRIARPGLAGSSAIPSVAESPDVVAVALGTLGGILWVLYGSGR